MKLIRHEEEPEMPEKEAQAARRADCAHCGMDRSRRALSGAARRWPQTGARQIYGHRGRQALVGVSAARKSRASCWRASHRRAPCGESGKAGVLATGRRGRARPSRLPDHARDSTHARAGREFSVSLRERSGDRHRATHGRVA
jgi:hypothetical protein